MTNQPSPDQTGAWEPDWDALTALLRRARNSNPSNDARLVIQAYRRQQAERGMVEVHAQDLWDAVTDLVDWECDVDHSPELAKIRGYAQRPEELRTTIREMLGLAAAQEQQ